MKKTLVALAIAGLATSAHAKVELFNDAGTVATVKGQIAAYMYTSDTDDKTALAITRELTYAEPVKSSARQNIDMGNSYISAQKHEKSGDVVIKIDNRVLTDKRLEQLTKLLANFN